MIIPSKTLNHNLSKISHGVFFESVNVGSKRAKIDLIAKLPTEIIKHIYLGTPTFISIRLIPIKNCFALCTILSVEDDPNAMFFLSRTYNPKDVNLIIQFLNQNEIELHAFDELNRNVVSFKSSFSVPDKIIETLVQFKPIICQLTDQEIRLILLKLEKEFANNDTSELKLIRFDFINYSNKPTFYHYPTGCDNPIFDPDRFNDPYKIDDGNQGRQFEINLVRLLSKIFDSKSLFPSPFGATPDSANRELIDLVAVWEKSLLLFEVKASAITPTSAQRSTERKVKNIEKQIRKAIRQLRGAYKKGIYNEVLTLKTISRTKEIKMSLYSVHLIIIVSEVHPDLDESKIVSEVISLGTELGLGVHVLDFQALTNHIRHCKDRNDFLMLLDRRWNLSLNNNALTFIDERFDMFTNLL